MVSDLPSIQGKIDVIAVKQSLMDSGYRQSPYLKCCAFQSVLGKFLGTDAPGIFVPDERISQVMKKLLQKDLLVMLSLENWCSWLEIMPLEVLECECVFHRMLVSCKITKFKEVNYKILSQILVTPKVLARIRSAENI